MPQYERKIYILGGMTGGKKRWGVEMKISIAMTSMLLFVFAAQGFDFALGAEQAAANDSINSSQMNETIKNTTLTELGFMIEVLGKKIDAIDGKINNTDVKMDRMLQRQEDLLVEIKGMNNSLNDTIENTTLAQSDSDPFANAKNRKPSSR